MIDDPNSISHENLDLQVALALGALEHTVAIVNGECIGYGIPDIDFPTSACYSGLFNPSTNWKLGGQIIYKHKISIAPKDDKWVAKLGTIEIESATPLVAAMHAFVEMNKISGVDPSSVV